MEIDTRMLGMIAALIVIWIGFQFWSGDGSWSEGTFLSARNLWNLSVQTSAVGIMATGMVLVIVSRNIDLSVGSMLAVIGMAMAMLQARWLAPDWLDFGSPWIWIITLVVGIAMGAVLGGLQGAVVAYAGVPSFIVTLGGLLVWRGVAWMMASGQTIAPMDATFQLLGGGARGTIGFFWSWVVGALAAAGIVFLTINNRRQRIRFGFHVRPLWADYTIAGASIAVVLIAVGYLNSYLLPPGLADQRGGGDIPFGLANPVLIAIGVALVMTFVATRLRFGRYVYAIGGNPEAAELAGIKTKATIVKTFALMGVLVAIGSAVQVARLNAAVSGLGQLTELYVIAAAVIGGTSLTGGIGTIPGAMLGALVMQSLQSGMALVGVETAAQDIAVGVVLVFAVGFDTVYRKRASA
jgi:D-xylose transport system permease protein